MPRCCTCKLQKNAEFFSVSTVTKTGFAKRCKACMNKASRKSYQNNLEKQRERSRKRTAEHPEKRKFSRDSWINKNIDYFQDYYKKNKDRIVKNQNYYKKRNPVVINLISSAYRAKKFNATPQWANRELIKMWYEVAAVLRRSGVNFQVDHIVPLAGENVCGLHTHDNLQILTKAENVRKKNRFDVGANHG